VGICFVDHALIHGYKAITLALLAALMLETRFSQ